ncbi:MAG: class I SAM-dependent methyltransferase [Methanobacterium sp.]
MDLYFIAILIFVIVIPIIIIWIMWTAVIGAGFEPTSKRKVNEMLEMAGIGPNDTLYDLGSGDGRIVFEAVKHYNAQAVGIEADPIRVLWSRMFLFFNRLQNKSKIKWGNFFNFDISEATAVTLFLGDKANQKLKEKLVNELKPGTPVVSYVWTFDGWEPTKVNHKDRIYLYTIGKSNYMF